MIIDWRNPESKVSKNFTVKDAIWLPKWSRLADDSDGLSAFVKETLEVFFLGPVEDVRTLIDVPMSVHCCFRPKAYNELVGGALDSAHLCGGPWAALDFSPMMPLWPISQNCDSVRAILAPKLQSLGIRMEYKPGSDWVHIDNHPVKSTRYFKP